ncbi:adenine-specific DNA methylase [Geobacillus subterraneus]|uniref:Adenine-specific DNA methylase n=1 Tax=Geobacillus subterraneus TaxID=129338 RepID=A0A679FS86_9BACL|nr:adenine-specific DNA methylase [Geobacillus subterraneus]BBW98990.1 hypothetical protein GsuE55_38230 [Geobacillus subterraneus]
MNISRVWSMPNKHTFLIPPIRDLIERYVTTGVWLDPFANNNTLLTILSSRLNNVDIITNDLNEEYPTHFHLDAWSFLTMFSNDSVDGVVYDPPYSPRQVAECYKGIGKQVVMENTQASFWSKHKDQIARIVKPNGIVLSFGWNSMGMGESRGFEKEEILLVAHGGQHNDTICVVERKTKDVPKFRARS